MRIEYEANAEGIVRMGLDRLLDFQRAGLTNDKLIYEIRAYEEIIKRRLCDDFLIWKRDNFRLHRRGGAPDLYLEERKGEK